MSIQSILDRNRREVITIRATETVKSAADRMREEREIVHAVSRHGERALSMAVADVVTHATITVAPDDTLEARYEPDDVSRRAAFARDCRRQARRHRRCC
jgi:CBS domain-containing protein